MRSLFHGGHLPPPLAGAEEEPVALGALSHPFNSHTALTDRLMGCHGGCCSGHRTSTDFKSQHQVSHYRRFFYIVFKIVKITSLSPELFSAGSTLRFLWHKHPNGFFTDSNLAPKKCALSANRLPNFWEMDKKLQMTFDSANQFIEGPEKSFTFLWWSSTSAEPFWILTSRPWHLR